MSRNTSSPVVTRLNARVVGTPRWNIASLHKNSRIDERSTARLPALDEVRAAVVREWENVRSNEALDAFYDDMLGRYEVRVEWPDETSERD